MKRGDIGRGSMESEQDRGRDTDGGREREGGGFEGMRLRKDGTEGDREQGGEEVVVAMGVPITGCKKMHISSVFI